MMANFRRDIARALFPARLFERIVAIRSRRHQLRLLEKEGILDMTARYIQRNGLSILYGPFAGMLYPRDAALSRISIPKLLGTYEQELHPIISEIERRHYDVVIDIGSAEGYYAVGLARLLRAKVMAFDPEPRERRFCREAANLNGVSDLVTLRDLFLPSMVKELANLQALCICDCEGFESHIFSVENVSYTHNWDLLIELHGDAGSRLPALPWPHRTHLIDSTPRKGDFPEIRQLGDPEILLSEYRLSPQKWLWCKNLRQAE
jgi:hypothetical protein